MFYIYNNLYTPRMEGGGACTPYRTPNAPLNGRDTIIQIIERRKLQ